MFTSFPSTLNFTRASISIAEEEEAVNRLSPAGILPIKCPDRMRQRGAYIKAPWSGHCLRVSSFTLVPSGEDQFELSLAECRKSASTIQWKTKNSS